MPLSDTRSDLAKLLTLIAGKDKGDRSRMLKRFSGFQGEGGKEVYAKSLSRMSEKWAAMTIDKIVQALADGKVHAHFNEKGEKVQHGLFD